MQEGITDLEIENKTQWHPGSCMGIELELIENHRDLECEMEHVLNNGPLRVDLLIIKKKPDVRIRNEIGAIFSGHNIVEYKSPDDAMNIDTFYKVMGYACLYKADTGAVDEIRDTDVTITLIREKKPEKMLRQLSERWDVGNGGNGIYYIEGLPFLAQVIVTKELESGAHVWLKALTRDMDEEQACRLVESCASLKGNEEYYAKAQALMALASDVNTKVFEKIVAGGGKMSDALRALIMPEIERMASELAEKDEKLAEKDEKLAEKDVEIERLRRRLIEVGVTP